MSRSEHERKSGLLAQLASLLPVHSGPELRIEQFRIEFHVGAHLGILFSRDNLVVDHEDHFRRYPATTKFLILVELSLLRLRPIFTGGTKHPDKVKLILVD